MQRRKLVWGVTAVVAVLGFMLTVQITSRPNYSDGSTSYIDLRTQVQEQAQEHQLLEQDIAKANAQIDEYKAAGSQSDKEQVLEQEEKEVAQQAGITPVTGPGLTITIQTDLKNSFASADDVSLFQNQADQYLADVVNVLFGNGATAVSINGHRLVTTSSIRLVSGLTGLEGVHVNSHPITMPYVISAVGDVTNMQAALTVQKFDAEFAVMGQTFQVTTFTGTKGVTVPGYSGLLPGQWAKEGSGQ